MASSKIDRILQGLRLPLIAAPMFLVSGPELIVAAGSCGVVGSFPTANCRTSSELDKWINEIAERLDENEQTSGVRSAPYCPNLIVHKSNTRLQDDLSVLVKHRPQMVITSVGSPDAVLPPLQDVGTIVFADVATLRHAKKAVEAGVDGLVLLTAGAGGQTGWLNPFAFVREVRTFFDGPIVLAGGISDGQALRAAEVLGCDFGYMGTKFIATHESMASDKYKQMLIDGDADDILLTKAFTGLEANMLRQSVIKAGLDPDNLPARGNINVAEDLDVKKSGANTERWKDIWTAGHSVSGVKAAVSVSSLITQTETEYQTAISRYM